jgi:hypothetical protein
LWPFNRVALPLLGEWARGQRTELAVAKSLIPYRQSLVAYQVKGFHI